MNKLLKTLIAGVSALTMCISAMPLSASAATTSYKKGDINGDGIVNSSDVLALNKFLHGSAGARNYLIAERLDLNRDYIIDNNDLTLLKNISIGLASSNQVPSVSTSDTVTQVTYHFNELKYSKFNAVNGKEIENYQISEATNITFSNINTTDGILDGDNRKVDYNQSAVVVITADNKIVGTGFIIDSNKIVTAAHVLYDTSTNTAKKNIKYILFNSNGQKIDVNGNVISNQNTYYGISANSYHIPQMYIDAKRYDNNNSDGNALSSGFYQDYALIKVNEDLSAYKSFDVGVFRDGIANTSRKIFITGYTTDNQEDSDKNGGNDELRGKIVTGDGDLCKALGRGNKITNTNLFYNVDVLSGESGGPIYVKNSNGSKTVVGINTGMSSYGFNQGTRFNTKILTFMFNNPKF